MRTARRLATWLAFSNEERRTLIGLMVGLPLVAALIRIAGVMRTLRIVERTSERQPLHTLTEHDVASARSLVQLAATAGARGLIGATCLRQSMLVYWLLRRRGLSPEFQIGVQRVGADLDAHAWIELQGYALGSRDSHIILGQLSGQTALS